MPIERLAVLAAVQTAKHIQNGNTTYGNGSAIQGHNMSSNGSGRSGRFETDLHRNVNILLGGAMMSGVIIVVVLICYCCHRNVRKNRPQDYSQYWRAEPDVQSLEVFTMDSHAMERPGTEVIRVNCNKRLRMMKRFGYECYERIAGINIEEGTVALPCPGTPGPPPTYESLIFNPHSLPSPSDKKDEPLTPGNILPVPMQADVERSTKEVQIVKDDEGLPSYEAALKLEANGYV